MMFLYDLVPTNSRTGTCLLPTEVVSDKKYISNSNQINSSVCIKKSCDFVLTEHVIAKLRMIRSDKPVDQPHSKIAEMLFWSF